MKPAPFRYARPGDTDAVVALLATEGRCARLLAGGQSLMPLMSRRVERPELIIDINRVAGLDRIDVLDGHIRMGALVRQQQALRSRVVGAEIPGLAAALAWVANAVVRSRGTVVGNLVTNSPGAELPAVALALDAQLIVRYADREETIPAAAAMRGGPGLGGRNRPDVFASALVTHVLWPRRVARAGFYEVARRAGHVPVVSSLVTVREAADPDCRVSLSGVCVSGLSCKAAARVIAECFPREPSVAELARALQTDLAGPLHSDLYSDSDYRREVAPRVIQRAWQRMQALDLAA